MKTKLIPKDSPLVKIAKDSGARIIDQFPNWQMDDLQPVTQYVQIIATSPEMQELLDREGKS